jgi:2-oxoglutarate ferredoxin oxidoreductase subunit gamma
MREDIFLAGLGGQGVLVAGQLLLEAAVKAGLHGAGMPAYLPEVRGGETTFTVVIADGPVGSPIVGRPHNLLLMDASSVANHLPRAANGALAIVNSSLCAPSHYRQELTLVPVPATELAQQAGSERAANMVMLGVFLAHKPLLPLDHLVAVMEQAFAQRPTHVVETNARAIRAGWEAGKAQSR